MSELDANRPRRWLLSAGRGLSSPWPWILAGWVLLAVVAVPALTRDDERGQGTRPSPVLPTAAGNRAAASARAVVVFQEEDCDGALGVFPVLNRLHGSPGWHVTGFLVAEDGGRREGGLPIAVRNLAPKFPVRSVSPQEAARVLARFGYQSTPLTVVYDSHRRVRLTVGSRPVGRPGRDLRAVVGRLSAERASRGD